VCEREIETRRERERERERAGGGGGRGRDLIRKLSTFLFSIASQVPYRYFVLGLQATDNEGRY